MTVEWRFLPTKYECKRTHHATINVFLQKDIKVEANNNIQIKLPLSFKIFGGIVALNSINERLVPAREIYMKHSPEDGLVVTFYKKSLHRVDIERGEPLCILRYVE